MAQNTILGTDSVKDALKTKANDDFTEYFVTQAEVVAARDGEDSLLEKEEAQDASIAALAAGSGAVVSANDTTVGYLNGKLLAGEGVDFTEGNDGGDETLTISCEDASVSNKGVVELTTDTEAITGTDTVRVVPASALTEVLRAHFLL